VPRRESLKAREDPPGRRAWRSGDHQHDRPGSRLAALAKKLSELERDEERLVRQLEDAGVDVDRRGDARPETIFAVADEMAQATAGGST
jgi:hypothetical protein